ncbi:prolipoprotein diacylglyceryl transferase [Pedobacter cryoconitis]|uniref:Phosphatidylglycerol--prolipoprotein diacylglyceryl transferase n=1 Tax=Pedobacter cryoconitis TaxID=188932 RepID=A0A7W8ZLB2_9SPHI|nr:prolipoprotein diacylglyceryl transferase [Pedobacter cryoconitis]MBB5636101.1 prolipoprotein diacylglyceryl transferase [Pedobacter cryoconitis]MBB6272977.1 prolipoprotein diacylglyceryl transferase [Pedobacter cryoconitis]
MSIATIIWNPGDSIIDLGFFALKYYSLFFLLAFVSSYIVVKKQFIKYGIDVELMDSLTIYTVLGTLIGARLGHVLFYDFAYFSKHPLEAILPVTFSPHFRITGFLGLASHGGGIGIMLGLILFSRKFKIKLWFLLDQIALVVPLAGTFIRLGNLMNSEIIGKPTDVSWAFVFLRDDNIPRHPAQLYEAIAYLLIFGFVYLLMKKYPRSSGFYFGLVIFLIFCFRLGIEFIKEDQSAFEAGMFLNMGQLLSIPFILTGMVIMYLKRSEPENTPMKTVKQ